MSNVIDLFRKSKEIAEEIDITDRAERKLRKKILRLIEVSGCNTATVGITCSLLTVVCAVKIGMPRDNFIELMAGAYDIETNEKAEREANDHH